MPEKITKTIKKNNFWIITACLICLAAGKLGSETLTLTTYYPAPYGVYARMVTTGKTYLARDTGNVGIGTSNPSEKLDVLGNAAVRGDAKVDGLILNGIRIPAPPSDKTLSWANIQIPGGSTWTDPPYVGPCRSDTCDGTYNTRYVCQPLEEKQCVDVSYSDSGTDTDTYGPWVPAGGADTCNGNTFLSYTCPSTLNTSCVDVRRIWIFPRRRNVTCRAKIRTCVDTHVDCSMTDIMVLIAK